MDHIYLSFLFLFFSYILSLLHMDGISIVLQLVLLVFFQYIYYTLTIHPLPRFEYVQNCVSCGKMTPQHYVHCSKCKKCVPVLFQHYDIIGMCVSKKTFRRYVFFKRFMLFQQTILSIIMSFNYPGLLFMVTINVYILYKSYRYDLNEIRV